LDWSVELIETSHILSKRCSWSDASRGFLQCIDAADLCHMSTVVDE
jgi:hypothetical protein